jgi:hypothetical protein
MQIRIRICSFDRRIQIQESRKHTETISVVDLDPYVFGPPRSVSGSVSHMYGSGSRSFHHQAKTARKITISTVLLDRGTELRIRIRTKISLIYNTGIYASRTPVFRQQMFIIFVDVVSDEDEELDITGLDDEEIDSYIMSSEEIKQKSKLWMMVRSAI